jgi:hypothetical protein
MEAPETRETKSGDVHIAYQVFGDGGQDLEGVPKARRLFEVTVA